VVYLAIRPNGEAGSSARQDQVSFIWEALFAPMEE